MSPKEIAAEEKAQHRFRDRAHRWEMACRSVRSGLIAADAIPIEPEWIAAFHAVVPDFSLDRIIASIRQALASEVFTRTEITSLSATAIDAANTRTANDESEINEFWRTLDDRLREADREYP